MSEERGYSMLQYKPGDEKGFFELLRIAMGEPLVKKRTEEFWSWKHLQNPFGVSKGLYAVDDASKKAIALRILMRWTFKMRDGAGVSAVRAIDTCTHPECRRKGMFSTLTKQAIADVKKDAVQFIFNTPNRNSLPGYLKMGWAIVDKLPLYFKITSPFTFILKAMGLLKRKTAVPEVIDKNDFFGKEVYDWNEFLEKHREEIRGVIEGWEKARKPGGGRYRTARDLAYFDWRYGKHPYISYKVHASRDERGLAGFVIMRPNYRNGLKEVVIAEMYLREHRADLAQRLLGGLRGNIRAEYLVTHFSDGTIEKDMLGKAGFLRLPFKRMTFTVLPLQPDRSDATRAANWDLSMGDLEVF